MKIETTIENIGKLIEWYHNKSATAQISELLTAKDRLCVYSWHLANECADLKREYGRAYFNRKVSINRVKQALMMEKYTASRADAVSISENSDRLSAEMEAESNVYRADLLLGQCNTVIRAMEQRVSFMKQELNNSKQSV